MPTPEQTAADPEPQKIAPADVKEKRLERFQDVQVDEQQVHPNSLAWAEVVKRYSIGVLLLVAFVVASPLIAIYFGFEGLSAKDRVDAFFKWANTVLPTVVGLGSAVIAYYYGRNTK